MDHVTTRRRKDLLGGGLMIVLGVGAMIIGMGYQLGSLSRMGPGFFPVTLGAILTFTGLLIVVAARLARGEEAPSVVHVEWKAWLLIAASVVAFVLLGRHGGLLPATFAIVFISALADRDNTVLGAAILAAGVSVVCVIVFWWGLQMQLPLFGWGG
jgi:hypothetical protein